MKPNTVTYMYTNIISPCKLVSNGTDNESGHGYSSTCSLPNVWLVQEIKCITNDKDPSTVKRNERAYFYFCRHLLRGFLSLPVHGYVAARRQQLLHNKIHTRTDQLMMKLVSLTGFLQLLSTLI